MFDAKERIIGAAYVMQSNLAEHILNEIKRLQPTYDNASINEVAESVVLDSENLTENAKRERIIGAAMVMNKVEANTIWEKIMYYISFPESNPEELLQTIDENLKNSSTAEK